MFWLALGLTLAVTGGLIAWARWRRRVIEASYPSSWTHRGEVPPGADVALEVLGDMLPAPRRWGGVVTWYPEPFKCLIAATGGWSYWAYCNGIVADADVPELWVVSSDRVEETALAHEVAHLVFDVPDPMPDDVQAWVIEANVRIARALGRERSRP